MEGKSRDLVWSDAAMVMEKRIFNLPFSWQVSLPAASTTSPRLVNLIALLARFVIGSSGEHCGKQYFTRDNGRDRPGFELRFTAPAPLKIGNSDPAWEPST
jgi:hypothetical protein